MPERFIFRSCYWENLETYMRDGEVRAKNHANPQVGYQISYEGIVNRRGEEFFAPDGQPINSYVPFYYSPIQAMTFTIHQGNVALRDPNNHVLQNACLEDLAIMVCSADVAIQNYPHHHYITDIACNSSLIPNYGAGAQALQQLPNWVVFDESPLIAQIPEVKYQGVCRWFHDTDGHRANRSKQRMAELLVHNSFDFNLIECIVVFNSDVKSAIENWEIYGNYNIPVLLKPKYF